MFRSKRSEYWPHQVRTWHAGYEVGLRPLLRSDHAEWADVRARNRDWTGPWDSTSPRPEPVMTFRQVVDHQHRQALDGTILPWVLTVNQRIAGQVHVFSIVRGAQQGGTIGYWIDRAWAGRGIMPVGVALAIEHCFSDVGLHRIEINIRPENANSLRVVEKLQLRDEGVRKSFLHIAGDWRDHRTFAITADEFRPGELLGRVAQN